jgi:hypothetical protein
MKIFVVSLFFTFFLSVAQVLPRAELKVHIDLSEFTPEPEKFYRSHAQFGDLNNDGIYGDFIRYQNGRFAQAFAFDGSEKVSLLWSYESPANVSIPPDRYFYKYLIWDVDADGRTDVVAPFVTQEGMELRVLDGETGEVKHSLLTDIPHPSTDDTSEEWRIKITVANTRGLESPQDIVMLTEGDSDGDIYVYDAQLKLLWDTTSDNDTKGKIYAHFPWNYDITGDGKDELVGNVVMGSEGQPLWQATPEAWYEDDDYYNHLDHAFIADFLPESEGLEILVSHEYLHAKMFDSKGNVLWSMADENVASKDEAYKDAKISSLGRFGENGEWRIIVEDPPLITEDDETSKKLMLNMNGETVLTVQSYRDGYPFDWDGDRTRDELFSPRRGTLAAPFFGETIRLESLYEENALTPYAEDMRLYAIPLDIVSDYREDVVMIDEDELMIFGATGEAPFDYPSPWTVPAYRLLVANQMNDNHPERAVFDWSLLAND